MHSRPTLVPLCEQNLRTEVSTPAARRLRPPARRAAGRRTLTPEPHFDISAGPTPPSSLNMSCIDRSKNCTLYLFPITDVLGCCCFFHYREKKLPKCIESAKTLDAKSVRRSPPQPLPTCFCSFFFDTLDNKKCFIFMILPDLLLDRVSLCACVCVCLCGRSWRNENVSSRATVYLCGYLFE